MTASTCVARSPPQCLGDDDLFGSPDPLAISTNDENSFRKLASRGASRSQRKPHITQVLEDITLSSPRKIRRKTLQSSKSLLQSGPEQFPSPWKIRVTVEAEPEEVGFSMMRSISEATRVPLPDTSSPTKGPGGQSRNKTASRKLANKRRMAGTKGKQDGQVERADVRRLTDLDTGFLDEIETHQIKSEIKPRRRKLIKPHGTDIALANKSTVSSIATSLEPVDVHQLLNDNDDQDIAFHVDASSLPVRLQAEESPRYREPDLNRVPVRSRGGQPKPATVLTAEKILGTCEKPPIAALRPAKSSAAMDERARQVSAASAVTYPTPDASVRDEMEAHVTHIDPTEEHAGFDTVLESEGFTMIDLESIPSARNFVTCSDKPDNRQVEPIAPIERPDVIEQPRPVSYPILAPASPLSVRSSSSNLLHADSSPPTPTPPSLAPPREGQSGLSNTVLSCVYAEAERTSPRSPSLLAESPLHQAHTPLVPPKTSPELPSPPDQHYRAGQHAPRKSTESGPPRLVPVIRAGVALQGLLSPSIQTSFPTLSSVPRITSTGESDAPTRKERPDDLFVGFDSGTRRELRAGLRFGEELAKRQIHSSAKPIFPCQGELPRLNQGGRERQDSAWAGKGVSSGTPSLGSNSPQSTRVGSGADNNLPVLPEVPRTDIPTSPLEANQSCGSIVFLDAEARERRWQLEREAISRQIENANTSQVIVIDSEDEDEAGRPAANHDAFETRRSPAKSMIGEAEEDIWLAEAENAQYSAPHTDEDLFPRAERLQQHQRAKAVIWRPRRVLIPSPWKRGEDIGHKFINNDDASGMFWQQTKHNDLSKLLCRSPTNTNLGGAKKESLDANKTTDGWLAREEPSCKSGEGGTFGGLEVMSEHRTQEKNLSSSEAAVSGHEDQLTDEDRFAVDTDMAASSEHADESYEPLSRPFTPRTVPVKFNDSTDTSIDCQDQVQDSTELETPPTSPCRRRSPRSAIKGSRASISICHEAASPSLRKVAFSRHSLCIDVGGMETGMQVKGDTPSSLPSVFSDCQHSSRVEGSVGKTGLHGFVIKNSKSVEDATVPAPVNSGSTSWISKLTGWASHRPALGCPTSGPEEARREEAEDCSEVEYDSNFERETMTAIQCPKKVNPLRERHNSSECSLDASAARIPPPPDTLPISGFFSDDHYKHLHILYLKSLKSSFTRPGSIRPGLKKCIGQSCFSADGELAWEVTARDAEVVERWIRSFEGRGVREHVRDRDRGGTDCRSIEWDEWDLCKRLFSIVAGQELRREETMRRKEK